MMEVMKQMKKMGEVMKEFSPDEQNVIQRFLKALGNKAKSDPDFIAGIDSIKGAEEVKKIEH